MSHLEKVVNHVAVDASKIRQLNDFIKKEGADNPMAACAFSAVNVIRFGRGLAASGTKGNDISLLSSDKIFTTQPLFDGLDSCDSLLLTI